MEVQRGDAEARRRAKELFEVEAVRLTEERRFAKVGDVFRLSPYPSVYCWGRLVKRSKFFGLDALFNLVYIYDAFGYDRPPSAVLNPRNLIIGPTVVNNLGWTRGYWQIVASEEIAQRDLLDRHLFIRRRGTGSPADYDIVDEQERVVCDPTIDPHSLSQAGFSNFNYIDLILKFILRSRGLITD